ncbi:MAG: hypothetical protein ACXVB1_03775 [Pseudobdellovibrionaceae bacterium]
MTSFQLRYFFLTPLVVLAIIACAKRDSDFAKRAAEARNAANKPAPQASASPSPGKTVPPPNPSPSTSPATPADPSANIDNEDQDGTADLYKDHCDNLIKMEAQEGETELTLDDMLTKEKKASVLQSSEFYVEHATKDAKAKSQLHAASSQYVLPKDFSKTATDKNKITLICHTVKADKTSTQKMDAQFILPNEISEDGSVSVLRQDKIAIDNKATISTLSTLYSENFNLKKLLEDVRVKNSLIVKQADGNITIKLQLAETDEASGTATTAFISGVFTPKK